MAGMRTLDRNQVPMAAAGIKLLALALTLIILVVYLMSDYTYDLFITTIVILLVLTVVSLVLPVVFINSKIQSGIKICDMIYHGVAAIFALLASSLFLDRVTRFSESIRHSHHTGESFFSRYWTDVNNVALAAGILTIFLALVHLIIVVAVWRKK